MNCLLRLACIICIAEGPIAAGVAPEKSGEISSEGATLSAHCPARIGPTFSAPTALLGFWSRTGLVALAVFGLFEGHAYVHVGPFHRLGISVPCLQG